MPEIYTDEQALKIRRNNLLDETAYTETEHFRRHYGDAAFESWQKYRDALYETVAQVTQYPAEIVWPVKPEV